MKVSELTVEYLISFLHIDEPDEEIRNLLSEDLTEARSYVCSYTGLSDEEIDAHPEFVHAVCVLVQDMYDNRKLDLMSNGISYVNKVVESILGMHCVTLL